MKKKILVIVLAIISVSMLNVSAMTKEELKNKLAQTYTINGVDFQARPDDIVQLERYLAQNDLSESDMDYIAAKFDEVVALLESGNATSYETITVREKNKIIEIINDVTNKTSVKATVSKNTVIIYNADGTEFTRITFLVKQTGQNAIIFSVSLGITLAGMFLIARKIKKTNA